MKLQKPPRKLRVEHNILEGGTISTSPGDRQELFIRTALSWTDLARPQRQSTEQA